MLGICQVEKCIFYDATNYEFKSIKEIVLFTIDVWDDKEISINAVQQKWTAKDCKDLFQYDIVYEPCIVATWIEKRKDNEPLIYLMSEDDYMDELCFREVSSFEVTRSIHNDNAIIILYLLGNN